MPVIPLIIFLAALFLRVWQVAYPINVDEAYWMARGAGFMNRLLEGDFAGTYLRHHPGVTNMWLTGTGQLINTVIDFWLPNLLGVEEVPLKHSCFNRSNCPISLWIVPRLVQAVVTSACMVGVYVFCQKLFNKAIALIAITLLLSEPFFLGYQRFITTDALQADFSILAVLTLLIYFRARENWKCLVVSGIFLGLATASKIPAIFMVPAVIIWLIVIELKLWQPSFQSKGWLRTAIAFGLWGAIAIGVFWLIWPTLWVEPVATLQRLYADLLAESGRGNLFYLGKVQTPGIGFYPLVLLYRLSPVVQFGVIICLISLFVPQWRTKYNSELTALTIVTLVILGILSASDSKIGRYIVVIVPELVILAAAGYWQLAQGISNLSDSNWSRKFKKSRYILLFLGFIQAVMLLYLTPHYVSFYNPLFGGANVAQKYIHIGIGEGLDRAADILNQEPEVASLKVASWYNWAFTPYFQGETVGGWTRNPDRFLATNRIIFYINQIQRNIPNRKTIDYFLDQQPLHTISLAGADYLYVFPGLAPTAQDLEQIQDPLNLNLDNSLKLIGCDRILDKSDNKLALTFYWQTLANLSKETKLKIDLVDSRDRLVQSETREFVAGLIQPSDIPVNTSFRDAHSLKLGTNIQAGTYQIKLSLTNSGANSPRNSLNLGDFAI